MPMVNRRLFGQGIPGLRVTVPPVDPANVDLNSPVAIPALSPSSPLPGSRLLSSSLTQQISNGAFEQGENSNVLRLPHPGNTASPATNPLQPKEPSSPSFSTPPMLPSTPPISLTSMEVGAGDSSRYQSPISSGLRNKFASRYSSIASPTDSSSIKALNATEVSIFDFS